MTKLTKAQVATLQKERDEARGIIFDLFAPDTHYDGCLFKADRRMPCQCGYNDRMARYRAAIKAAKALRAEMETDAGRAALSTPESK